MGHMHMEGNHRCSNYASLKINYLCNVIQEWKFGQHKLWHNIRNMTHNWKMPIKKLSWIFPATSILLCTTFRSWAPLLWIVCVRFLVLLATVVALSPTWGIHILWYTWYPQMSPDTEKEHGTAVAVAIAISTNNVSAILQMCLSFIHQLWRATMTIHFWSQLICVMQQ